MTAVSLIKTERVLEDDGVLLVKLCGQEILQGSTYALPAKMAISVVDCEIAEGGRQGCRKRKKLWKKKKAPPQRGF
jgi:hypothetical protein